MKIQRIDISIHAPRGGSDANDPGAVPAAGNFNPRSPWGERLDPLQPTIRQREFQSTLPVGGATPVSRSKSVMTSEFQSTLPAGGATETYDKPPTLSDISIHAPRGGSDLPSPFLTVLTFLFQSTLPAGGATKPEKLTPGRLVFQSTLPAGGATLVVQLLHRSFCISIHAPRGGSDTAKIAIHRRTGNFNPRSPRGERQSLL